MILKSGVVFDESDDLLGVSRPVGQGSGTFPRYTKIVFGEEVVYRWGLKGSE